MRIRNVYVEGSPGRFVAVWHKEKWLPLLFLIKEMPRDFTDDEKRMAGDLISFLEAGEGRQQALMEKIDNLLSGSSGISWQIQDRSVLPFEPLSYRDFMLFEEHVIQAGRGFVKQFKPRTHQMVSWYEKITGKTFPRFKPSPLWYKKPIYYMGNHLSFVENGHPVKFPSYSRALDYELEIGAVIARPVKNAEPADALGAIGGFVVFNDFSARDVQLPEMKSGFGPVKAKNFINSISDVVVTSDEILPHLLELKAEVQINEECISRTSASGMYHGLGKAIAYASLEEQLYPGEFIATGTLPGGCAMENGRWLKVGDTITLSIDRIGTLTNQIV